MQVELKHLELARAPNSLEVKILVVDDNVPHLEHQVSVLQRQGLVAMACASYATAERLIESERFDFVLSSQGRPTFEGRRVLERAAPAEPPVPVLVFTDWADMNAYVQSISLGAVDYLEKPLSLSELIIVIRRQLQLEGPRLEAPTAASHLARGSLKKGEVPCRSAQHN